MSTLKKTLNTKGPYDLWVRQASSKKRKWSEKEQTTEKTWEKGPDLSAKRIYMGVSNNKGYLILGSFLSGSYYLGY